MRGPVFAIHFELLSVCSTALVKVVDILHHHEKEALFEEVQAVFPEQKPIDRTGLNSWDDQRVRDWVKETGKRKLVMAGLWTEVCLCMAVLSALAAGHEVYIVTDASGGSNEGHERAVQRMVQAGARPLTAAGLHGGKVQIESKFGEGTTVTVRFSAF